MTLRTALLAATVSLAVPTALPAQVATPVIAITGTSLDIVARGETRRVPDIATVSAGVVTQAADAASALRENAARMARVSAALKKAGIADRDIQTSNIALNPQYKYGENVPPIITGYQASNTVSVRFRDIGKAGAILDALVATGANQINGPDLTLDKPEEAMDEARLDAMKTARSRAELYAKAAGLRVKRILSISESGDLPPPMPIMVTARRMSMDVAESKISAGEQTVGVTLSVRFELE